MLSMISGIYLSLYEKFMYIYEILILSLSLSQFTAGSLHELQKGSADMPSFNPRPIILAFLCCYQCKIL